MFYFLIPILDNKLVQLLKKTHQLPNYALKSVFYSVTSTFNFWKSNTAKLLYVKFIVVIFHIMLKARNGIVLN